MPAPSLPAESPVGYSAPCDADLAVTEFFDHDDKSIVEFANEVTSGLDDDVSKAVALFAEVRDRIRYDPHNLSSNPADHRASAVLAGSQSWCVPKSVLLSSACRAVGIPARLGFSDVRNHLQSPALAERMGTELFYWHGYSVMWLDGEWRKASPAFNTELCERFGTEALHFDGHSDALLHAHDGDGNQHMEYVNDRGIYTDLPLEEIFESFAELYGSDLLDATDD
jgi:transglutaminase-like putative cysteine protease